MQGPGSRCGWIPEGRNAGRTGALAGEFDDETSGPNPDNRFERMKGRTTGLFVILRVFAFIETRP